MEFFKTKRIFLILLLSVSVGMTGCNDVEFAPGKNHPSQPDEDPGGFDIQKDTFFQKGGNPAVDILFVVDNSGSMADEQAKLGDRIKNFLSHLDGVDWQLGITTTDVSNGSYGLRGSLLTWEGTGSKILTKDVTNFEKTFLKTVVRKETSDCSHDCPSGDEQALKAVMLAMDKRNSTNAGFFRLNADLAVVFLSDEDEMSTGPVNATKPEDVLAHFRSIWGDTKRMDAYGIVIAPGDTACYNEQYSSGGNFGTHVASLVDKTRGLLGSICDQDYGSTLGQIGDRVLTLLTSFELTKKPMMNSILVKMDPEQNISWQLKGKAIKFSSAPAAGTRITISYKAE